jgi:hypothetical protein
MHEITIMVGHTWYFSVQSSLIMPDTIIPFTIFILILELMCKGKRKVVVQLCFPEEGSSTNFTKYIEGNGLLQPQP